MKCQGQHIPRFREQLIDPQTGEVLSRMRPDVFAYSPGPPKKVFIGEAVVTTTGEERTSTGFFVSRRGCRDAKRWRLRPY